jgi:hypothetical protein
MLRKYYDAPIDSFMDHNESNSLLKQCSNIVCFSDIPTNAHSARFDDADVHDSKM